MQRGVVHVRHERINLSAGRGGNTNRPDRGDVGWINVNVGCWRNTGVDSVYRCRKDSESGQEIYALWFTTEIQTFDMAILGYENENKGLVFIASVIQGPCEECFDMVSFWSCVWDWLATISNVPEQRGLEA